MFDLYIGEFFCNFMYTI